MENVTLEIFNSSYVGDRPDLLALIPRSCSSVLDVGCAAGALGKRLRVERPESRVVGIERNAEMAAVARSELDRVIVADIDDLNVLKDELRSEEKFDCIICGDILEHLQDPWATVRILSGFLSEEGCMVASLPNVGHWDTLVNVFVLQQWPYRSRGVHDSTHLRHFCFKNVLELFEGAGLEIVVLKRTYRIIERPNRLNKFSKILAVPGIKSLLTFQFLVVATGTKGSRPRGAFGTSR